MEKFYLALAAFLVLNIAAGLVRILRGPTPADRMLAAQLFGTTGVAILLLLAEAQAMPASRDVALVFAALAALAVIAFVRRVWYREERSINGATRRRRDFDG
jgi:multicomponent Na+:H+ antiporter subunit F